MMRHRYRKAGFSLIEVNMAIFVMAVGIVGMVALFPLGLREGIQGRADLKQSMFADHVLNQMVALLSQTNVTWSEWSSLDQTAWPEQTETMVAERNEKITWGRASLSSLPNFDSRTLTDGWKNGGTELNNNQYRVFFRLVGGEKATNVGLPPGPSQRVMGIGVRSTDLNVNHYDRYTNNVLYYAEAMFQGVPN